MQLVTVKNKYQVVIPQKVREAIGVAVGDILEAKVERGKITLTPKSVLDRDIYEAIKEIEAGHVHGPFSTADEALAVLHAEAKKVRSRRRRSAR